jgi:hypothetical protein
VTDNEEISLLYTIYQFANRNNWGQEKDILADIWGPAKPGDPAPKGKGQITLRIDWQGVATVELIARGPLPAVARTTVEDASRRLKSDFGFSEVEGFKDPDEISDVLGAMQFLNKRAPKDIVALNGVKLKRVKELYNYDKSGKIIDANRTGEFYAGITESTKAASEPYLKLADRAFAEFNQTIFFGGGPMSPSVSAIFQTVAHEVGHAVETKEYRDAYDKYVKESAKYATTEKEVDKEWEELKSLKAPKRGKEKFYQDISERSKKNNERKEQAQLHVDAAERQKEQTKSTDPSPEIRTRRLQKFIDLVNAKNIRPFTPYSAINWPHNPQEFYAEAYSLWIVDQDFLKNNYEVVYNFFQSGDYL